MLHKLLLCRNSSLRFKRDCCASNIRCFSPSQLPSEGDADQGTTRVTVGGGKVTLEHLGPGIGERWNSQRARQDTDQVHLHKNGEL